MQLPVAEMGRTLGTAGLGVVGGGDQEFHSGPVNCEKSMSDLRCVTVVNV